jgi:hypothetical protein
LCVQVGMPFRPAPEGTVLSAEEYTACMARGMHASLGIDPSEKLTRKQHVALGKLCVFEQYVRELQCVRLVAWKRKDLQAFLLNVYNAMLEHGIVRYGCPIVNDDVVALRKAMVYRIGFMDFSLDTLYHVVFRGNERPVCLPRCSVSLCAVML